MTMTGKEIIDAIKEGHHVCVQSSTGRHLVATELSNHHDDTEGVDGYNRHGEPSTMGIGLDIRYQAYILDFTGCPEVNTL
jgi:hypothetical protein